MMTERFYSKFEEIINEDFVTIYDKVYRDVMWRWKSYSVNNITMTGEQFIKDLKYHPGEMVDKLRKLLGHSNEIRAVLVDVDIFDYELFIIEAKDLSIKDSEDFPGCDAVFTQCGCCFPEDISKHIRCGFIIMGSNNPSYKGDNINHILEHELVHAVFDYMAYKCKDFNDICIKLTDDEIEFLADFLPFHYKFENSKDKDILVEFIDFAEKWFDKEVNDKYREFVKDVTLYYTNSKCY